MRPVIGILIAIICLALLPSGCSKPTPKPGSGRPRLVVVLLDETGSYVKDLNLWQPSRQLASSLVAGLQPSDAFCLIGIDATPYEAEDVRIPVTALAPSTLAAAIERRDLRTKVEGLEPRKSVGTGTPMTLAIAQAADVLASQQANYRPYLVIFSDMAEDPPKDGKQPQGLHSPLAFPSDTVVRAFYVAEVPGRGREEMIQRITHWKEAFSIWGVTSPPALYSMADSEKEARTFIRQLGLPE